jgi:2',3'-cyclic-nucleotide 2'-phosphodiesterase (5'-nucleotidase family)
MAAAPEPGLLRLLPARPNPLGAGREGAGAALLLLVGDAVSAPVRTILPADGAALPPPLPPAQRAVRLKLLHFNDLHGHLCCFGSPSGFAARTPSPIFSRIAPWIQANHARFDSDERVAVLAVSAGDEIGGSIFDELLGKDAAGFQAHAGYRLYSQAGLDAAALGNHDFDKGPALLGHAIRREAAFPLLAANVCPASGVDFPWSAAALFVLKGLRVGVIGLTTQAQLQLEASDAVCVADPVQTALHLIPAFRPLCDVLLILSHLGYSLDQGGALVQGAGDVELARQLPSGSVHLIVGGHTHHALNHKGLSAANIVAGIPIVQAGQMGQYVGEVDLAAEDNAIVTHARLSAVIDLPSDDDFERQHVQPLVDLARPFWHRRLGRVAFDDDLSTDAVRNRFTMAESALANFITDALVSQSHRHSYPVDLAMIDASCVRCGLPVGDELSFGDLFDLLPFADTLCLFPMSGRQLHQLLNDNALRLARPDEPNTERGFLHFSAHLRYGIAPGPARGRATVITPTVGGRPLADCLDSAFLVAATSFVRGPAAAWEDYARRSLGLSLLDLPAWSHTRTHLYVRDLLVAEILALGGIGPEGGARRDGRLQIAPFSAAGNTPALAGREGDGR